MSKVVALLARWGKGALLASLGLIAICPVYSALAQPRIMSTPYPAMRVVEAPAITTHPASATVSQGARATFSVVATGTAPLAYRWSRNGAQVPACTQAACVIASATAADAGSYTVNVSNAAGAVTSAAAVLTVTQNIAPSITTQPASVTVNEGARATFSVVATGTAPLAYRWSRNGAQMPACTQATCVIASATAADAGSYTVNVSNTVGAVTSQVATLTVNPLNVAKSCSAADVQAALNSAPAGGSVKIPAGTCDWKDSMVALTLKGDLTVSGAGMGQTVIRRTTAVSASASEQDKGFVLRFTCIAGSRLDISGMSLIGNDNVSGLNTDAARRDDYDSGVGLLGPCRDFKVHGMEFNEFSNSGLYLRGAAQRGVIYQNEFKSNFKCSSTDSSYPCYGYGVVVYGDGSARPLELGTAESVFVEANYFHDNRHSIASNNGSRYVFRYNDIVSSQRARNWAEIDAHGGSRGSSSWEIYNNTLTTESSSVIASSVGIRGGDGVIFDNTFFRYPYVLYLTSDTSCSGSYPVAGQSRSVHLWNNTWTTINGYDADKQPDNTRTGVNVYGSGCAQYLQQGRDWYLFKRPNYNAYPYPHPLRNGNRFQVAPPVVQKTPTYHGRPSRTPPAVSAGK